MSNPGNPTMNPREYLDRCLTALTLEAPSSVVDEVRRAIDAVLAETAPMSSLVDRATVVAAGMVTDPPIWDGSDGGKIARHAVTIARQIENVVKTSPVGDAALRDSNGEENPVHCEFVRMARTSDSISYVARFEISGKSLTVMPRIDRERLLKILIVDALDATIKTGDL